ncbi:DUF998 domain-containing protein [uncultured Vagococcus sp.]|uniref:DUF998 domain-containing protein n=1 Tax=uncultured Vagococcus sp. TaxID=189676 RepID=UPI0028D01F26|nr:DUF998 domain-containing protein [uncultured Vagococcus sp.]
MNMLKKNGYLFLLAFSMSDFLIPYLLAFYYPSYRSLYQVVSDLGEAGSPVEAAFRYSAVVTGAILLLSLPTVYERYRTVSKSKASLLVIALAAFGIGQCILTGLFSVNRADIGFNVSVFIHQVGSFFGSVGMLFVPLLLGILSGKNGEPKVKNRYLCLFFLSCLFSSINGLSQLFGFQLEGLWQRLSLLCFYLPPVYLAISLKYEPHSSLS